MKHFDRQSKLRGATAFRTVQEDAIRWFYADALIHKDKRRDIMYQAGAPRRVQCWCDVHRCKQQERNVANEQGAGAGTLRVAERPQKPLSAAPQEPSGVK